MYMSAFKLNPFGPHAADAKQALLQLAARQAHLDHPTDGPDVMAQTLALIERQAGDWKTMKIHAGNQTANRRVYEGTIQAARQFGYYQPNVPYLPPIPENKQVWQPIDIRQIRAGRATPNNPYTTVNINQPQVNNWAGYPGNNYGTPGGAGVTSYGGGALGAPFNGTGLGAPGFAANNFPPLPAMPGLNPIGLSPMNYGVPGLNPPNNLINPNPNLNLYGPGGTSNLSGIRSSYIRSDSSVQAMRAQQEGLHSASELQKSANNLESLLGEQPKYGTPHLRALGTNLFVRNYSEHDDDSTAPADPPIELRAKAVKLSDVEKSEKGEKAKQLKLTP